MSSLAGVTAPSSEQACIYPPSSLLTHSGLSIPALQPVTGMGCWARRGRGVGGWVGVGQYVDGEIFSDDLGMDSSSSQSLAVLLMLSETLPVGEGL